MGNQLILLLLLLLLIRPDELCAQAQRTPMQPAPTPTQKGSMLLLHYRWRHDSLTLIKSERIPAAIKPPRPSPGKRSRNPATAVGEPRTAFSYELLGADGRWIATRYLQDPGLRRVEYREEGQAGMKSQVERADSADIFLRIPEADARTIRFFRHAGPLSPTSSSPPLRDPETEPKAAPKATAVGSDPRPSKAMVAEFPLR